MTRKTQILLISLGLVVLTLAVFWRVSGYGYASYDDTAYLEDNPYVRNGLSRENIVWAFTTWHKGYWHPVTWISHMLDCEWFGLNPGAHHMGNVVFHVANTLLLFGLLWRTTGRAGRSAFVAALFAVHPLHVESVAWIAERKDVLSTFFWMLTVWAYVEFVREKGPRPYMLALLAYAVGLMAKPMIVTLPAILLLLDVWPLQRRASWARLLTEKVPFLALSAASAVITYLTTTWSGAMGEAETYPLAMRLRNVTVSYAAYLAKMVWPDRMAFLYPFEHDLPAGRVAWSALLLAAVCALVLVQGRRRPYLLTGWLWYLLMLLPVIGLIQAGAQSMADRYSYLSLVGIFVMAAWGIPDLVEIAPAGARNAASRVMPALAVLVVGALALRAWFQVGIWRDAITVTRHAVHVTKDNYIQLNNLGLLLEKEGRYDEAVSNYMEALRIRPGYAPAQNNLGSALMRRGDLDQAIVQLEEAVKTHPSYGEAHNNLGIALARQDRLDEAIAHFLAALTLNPNISSRQKNLLVAIGKLQDADKAAAYYRQALEIAEGTGQAELADVVREKLQTTRR